MNDPTPCHTGPAAHVCGYCVSLLEVDVDTAELEAVTREPEFSPCALRDALLESVLHACTCISCGAPYGRTHNPGCPQTSFRDGAGGGPVDARNLGGILVLDGAR